MICPARTHSASDDPDDTAALGRKLQKDDGMAFARLYEKIAPALYAYACPRLGWRTADAEDVVSEVWVRARQKFSEFQPDRNFRSWIFGFTVRVVLEYQGRLTRMTRSRSGDSSVCGLDPDQIPEEASSISRRVARDEELLRFVEWARKLSDYEQEVLLLRGLQGRPHQEISELLGRTEEAVRRCWSRLIKRIEERSDASAVELVR